MGKNVVQINGGIMINVYVSVKIVMYVKKIVLNPGTCNCENKKYLVSIMDDSVTICDEFIDEDAGVEAKSNDEAKSNNAKLSPKDSKTNFNQNKATWKKQKFYVSLAFLLSTIALLIAVSIYCYLIQY